MSPHRRSGGRFILWVESGRHYVLSAVNLTTLLYLEVEKKKEKKNSVNIA